MAYSRLSVPGSKLFATCNPESGMHWFKKKVVDKIEDFNGTYTHFTMDDNPGLTPAFKERMRNSYSGHWKARYVDGLWASASGLIYPEWHGYSVGVSRDVRPTIALDFGLSSVFAALMIKPAGGGHIITNEYIYDATENRTRTEGEHVEAVMKWIDIHYTGSPHGIVVYVDP